ncbi:MAG: DNA-directed RNA polymerase subunit alpha C-terminal domain-containing protein [Chitinophagaceae bacterium]
MPTTRQHRTCPNGHVYYKTSDCPVCPQCETDKRPQSGWLAKLAAPARRALANAGIQTVQQLASFSEKEILSLHGMGPGSLPHLHAAMKEARLSFKKG